METKAKQIRLFILSVIHQREELIRLGKSKKNELLMLSNIDSLNIYLETYPYANELNMAKFYLRNMTKIESLLPGHGSKDYNARQSEFLAMGQMCEDLINPELNI